MRSRGHVPPSSTRTTAIATRPAPLLKAHAPPALDRPACWRFCYQRGTRSAHRRAKAEGHRRHRRMTTSVRPTSRASNMPRTEGASPRAQFPRAIACRLGRKRAPSRRPPRRRARPFDDKLPNDPSTRCAERRTNGKLAASIERPEQEKTRHVRAGNQQHANRGPHQHEQLISSVAEHVLAQRVHHASRSSRLSRETHAELFRESHVYRRGLPRYRHLASAVQLRSGSAATANRRC